MTLVIDGLQLVRFKRRLPKEAFFVDTNVVIDSIDPFGRALEVPSVVKRNEKITEVLGKLKGQGFPYYTTIGVVAEYYKHIQIGFYLTETRKKIFDGTDFKRLRDSDVDFMDRWGFWMDEIKKTFKKKFPLYDVSPDAIMTLSTFEGGRADFGDHLLFESIMAAPESMRCVFSNDSDFYSFPDDLYLLTTNAEIIRSAKQDGKLH